VIELVGGQDAHTGGWRVMLPWPEPTRDV